MTIRGTFITGPVPGAHVAITGGQILIFDAGNNLVAQLDSAGIKTLGANSSTVTMRNGEVDIFPQHIAAATLTAAVLSAINTATGPVLTITSPQQFDTTPTTSASMQVRGANATSDGSLASLSGDTVQLSGFNNSSVQVGSNEAGVGGVTLIGGNGSEINIDTSLSGPNAIDFLATVLTHSGQPMGLLTSVTNFDATATLTLAVASAPIVGCAHTFTGLVANTKWAAIGTFDCGLGAVANTDVGELWLNTNGGGLVKQAGDASYNGGVNTRSSITRAWSGTFPAGGTLLFQLQGRQAGAGGVNVMANPGTTLQVSIYQ